MTKAKASSEPNGISRHLRNVGILIGIVVALGGAISGAFAYLESTYARIGSVEELRALYIQSQINDLESKAFELENAQDRSPLSDRERRRLKELRDQIKQHENELKDYRKKWPSAPRKEGP